MLRTFITRLSRALGSLRLAARNSSWFSGQGMLPLLVVLPVAIYAYLTQAVVSARSESWERELAMQSVRILGSRLVKIQNTAAATCRDYANWDECYEQVMLRDSVWIATNLDGGIGASFGFEIVLLQAASGEVVWQTGMDRRAIQDLRRYRLLEQCLKRRSPTGLLVLDDQVYSCCAAPILKTGGKGRPRGMILVGMLVDRGFLAELSPGPEDGVALRRTDGRVTAAFQAGSEASSRRALAEVFKRDSHPEHPTVEVSRDRMVSCGILPACDLAGRPLGALVNITSRASLMSNLKAIRLMSVSLMVLCGFFGLVGAAYLRNRAIALRANRDQLTGLYNHGFFQDRLRDLVEIARRYNRPLSLLMVDIDHFKYINDSRGHTAGDRVLKVLAAIMVDSFRATDLVARYGGEEFVVVLPETGVEAALLTAERLRQTVKNRGTGHSSDAAAGIAFTVSVGVAGMPGDAAGPGELIAAADTALGEAKRTRDCVFAYGHILSDPGHITERLSSLDSFFRDCSIATIRPLVKAIDMRKPGSANHSDKTAEYAVAIGKELGLSTQELALLCKAALLHDIGEIGISDQVIKKAGRLSASEFEIIKQHCAIGTQILSQSPSLAAAAEIVLCHHERYDGRGYPNGLVGENIPLLSRIIAVADSLDAMTSRRLHRKVKTMDQAMAELEAEAGKQFDPRVVEAAQRAISGLLVYPEEDRTAA